MQRKLKLFEYSFDRKVAFLEDNNIDTKNLSKEFIEEEFSRLSSIKEKSEKIAEEIKMRNVVKSGSSLRELISDLKQGKSKVVHLEDLKLKVQLKIVGVVKELKKEEKTKKVAKK